MKCIILLLYLLFTNFSGICQEPSISDTAYQITFGKYQFDVKGEFTTQTSYEFELSSNCANYTANEKPYLKTILFKNDTFSIQFPKTTDSILFLNCATAEEQMKIVSRDHILINKLIDTISLEELKMFLEKDITVVFGNDTMENIFFGGMVIENSGKKRGIRNQFVADRSIMFEQINLLSSGGYFIISGIFYQNKKKKFGVIEGAIGWMIM